MTRDPELMKRAEAARQALIRELEALLQAVYINPKPIADILHARLSALRGATAHTAAQVGSVHALEVITRLDALRGATDNGPDLSGHDDSGVRPARATPGDPARPSSALTDAEILDRAAGTMARELGGEHMHVVKSIRAVAAELRAPAPDWADRISDSLRAAITDRDVASVLRERVGRFFMLAKSLENDYSVDSDLRDEARAALAKLKGKP